MDPHLPHDLQLDDYQRLRDAAKLRAVQLRQEAIREAHAWAVQGLQRLAQRALYALRTRSLAARAFCSTSLIHPPWRP